jgi:hypothetical protein
VIPPEATGVIAGIFPEDQKDTEMPWKMEFYKKKQSWLSRRKVLRRLSSKHVGWRMQSNI